VKSGRRFETDRPAEQNVLLGMVLRICAGLALAIMFAGVKWAAQHGVSVVESLFYRQLGTTVAALAFVAIGPGLSSLRTKRVGGHVVRMGIGLLAMGLNFLAFAMLPMAEATAIGFSVPIFSTLLAAIVLGERTGIWRWGAVLAGFAGVMVIVQPGSGHIALAGGIVAIAAALTTALATIAIRHLGATEAAATTVFWFGASSLVPLSLAMLFAGRAHSAEIFLVLAIMAIAGGAAQLFLTGALRFAPVALVMPMDYLSLIWSSLLGFLIFSQLPTEWTLIGAPVVIAAGLVILWREQRLKRRAGAELVELAD
jgi:drug/metabolite transporter (DMT)-like permease